MIGTSVGQLVVQRRLGEGGMGAVYLAEHAVLRTPRAIKVLLPQWTQSAPIVQRFIDEARAAAAIRHRNIIEVHDCGRLPSGEWFIVLDYLDGETLAPVVRRGPLPLPVAVHVVCELANGLQAAHDHQIIHRDLKPDNIHVGARDGDPHRTTILDFGVAKLGERRAGGGTRTGTVIGTPAFMAPEQLRGEAVGPAADVFALGVVAYQVSTGRLPDQDESLDAYYELTAAELYHRQRTRPPIDPRRVCGELPAAWAAAICAALDPDPARRPASARALGLRLAEAVPGGLDTARTYARELFDLGGRDQTIHQIRQIGQIGRIGAPGSRYQLGERLGAGGMAEVFAGTAVGAEGFARRVAIKRVLDGHSQVPAFAAMFIEEARIASQLSHPNVVSVLDFDRDAAGRLFLVLEYVDGVDLETVVARGRLPAPVAIYVACEILRGLGYAHELPCGGAIRGVIHRDVSPQNVLVSWEGSVKVSDFGIAKALEASAGAHSGLVRGKPAYMSPEQVNAEVLDRRSDLFAVGIILWELLTGRRLFSGTTKELFAQVLFGEIGPPSRIRPDVPADLDAVVRKLLARRRDDRYARAEHAIDDLARCADHPRNGRSELVQLLARRFDDASRGRPAPRAGGWTVTAPAPRATTLGGAASQSLPPPVRLRRRRSWLWLAAGSVVFGAIVGLAIALVRGERASATEAVVGGAPATSARLAGGEGRAPRAAEVVVAVRTPSTSTDGGRGAAPRPEHAADQPATPAVDDDRRARASAAGSRGAADSDRRTAAEPAGAATGTLVVRVQPWAEVWIDGAPVGQTPVERRLRVGRHRVVLTNDRARKALTVDVAAQPTVIDESW